MKQKFIGGGLFNRSNSLQLQKFKEKNNKRKIIVITIIFSILVLSSIYLYNTFAVFTEEKHFNIINGTIGNPGDIYFAYYVDNNITLELPSEGSGYTLDNEKTTCTNNVSLSWDKENYSLIVNYQNYKASNYSKTKCNLYFKKENQTLISKITELSENTSSGLKKDDYNNIRYIGSNPNNYVYFNCSDYNNQTSSSCEKWRIIGLMKNIQDENGTATDLIKIIKDTTLESVTFGSTNNFSGSKIATTLNNSLVNDTTKNMTVNAIWSLGGTSAVKTASEMYNIERGTTVYGSNAKTITTRVGLMYPSDYGYATSGSLVNNLEMCSKTTLDNWTTYPNCAKNDWLSNNGTYPELTMTHYTGNSYSIYSIYTTGIVNTTTVMRPSGDESPYNDAKPVVYLKANLQITDGTGTTTNPYKLINTANDTNIDEIAKDNNKMLDESSSSCNNNVTISWNDTTNKIIINLKNYQIENKTRTKCDLKFKSKVQTAVDTIITLAATDTTNLVYDGTSDNNLRYIGADPNNYVSVDDELWRIIGVMNNIGEDKEQRIKLIRADAIDDASWDGGFEKNGTESMNEGYGVNEWSTSDIMKLLNPGYEDKEVGGSLYYNNMAGNIYKIKYYCLQCGGNSILIRSANYTKTGLKSNLKNLIADADWNLGASTWEKAEDGLAPNLYIAERSTTTGKICSGDTKRCDDTITRTTKWTGKVGLMYPSDYIYATSGGNTTDRNKCLETTILYEINNNHAYTGWNSYSDCIDNDWIKNGWTMTPAATTVSTSAFVVRENIYDNATVMVNDIRPVVYLKPLVKIVSGTGTSEDPYILGE